MDEQRIRDIVREEWAAIKREEAEAQAEADEFLAEIQERREKRDRQRRTYEEEERRKLEDRISDLESQQRRR